MSEPFDPNARRVSAPVWIDSPIQDFAFRFAIDTGATQTCIRAEYLQRMGYDLSRPVTHQRIRSATGTARVPVFRVSRVEALGQVRSDFLIAAHDLPPGVEADGLLGLDFFRGLILMLDFARGRASLSERKWWHLWR